MSSIFREQIVRQLDTPKPISIVEFCESDQYCNRPLYPAQRVLLKIWFIEELEGWEEDILSGWIAGKDNVVVSPGLRKRIEFLRDGNYPHFRQLINVVGRRGSKGYITGAAFAKLIYEVSQHADPGSYYGIDPEKQITFAVTAPKFGQAKKEQFGDVEAWVKNCKPLVRPGGPIRQFLAESFAVHTASDDRLRAELIANGVKVSSEWAKIVCMPLPANASTVRGSAAMGIIYDEMAHMIGVEGRASAEEVYAAAQPALRQFGRDAISFLNSTPWNMVGEFYDQAQNAMAMDGTQPAYPTSMLFWAPSWSLFRDYKKDPRHRFDHRGALQVAPEDDPATMTDQEKAVRQILLEEERQDPEKFAVETRAHWQATTEAYLNPLVVDRAYNPIFEVPEIGFTKPIQANWNGDYNYTYVMHGDPSSTTAGFGFACGHTEMLPDPFQIGETCQHVVFDFVWRWNPELFPGHTIRWERVIEDIVTWCKIFHPTSLTFDQFDSTAPVQTLQQLLPANRVSTMVGVKTATSGENFRRNEVAKTAFNLGLVHIPPNCIQDMSGREPQNHSDYSRLELRFLHVKNGKVEKQSTGPIRTKDVADCIMEVTTLLLGDYIDSRRAMLQQHIALGGQGGYQLGGRQSTGPMSGGEPNQPVLDAPGHHGLGGVRSFDELSESRRFGQRNKTFNPSRGMSSQRGKKRYY